MPGRTSDGSGEQPGMGVTVRYWAGARAAAGADQDVLGRCETVADVCAGVVALHPALAPVVAVSTLLLEGRPATAEERVSPGAVLEVLPPFAGG